MKDIKTILKEIKKNKGATLDKNGENLTAKNGFMVSLQGKEIQAKTSEELKENIREYIKYIQDRKGLFVGVWYDTMDECYYLDISIMVLDYLEALEVGRENRQKAIYDLKNNNSIYLTYKKYYTLYEVIKNKSGEVKDYKIIKQYDEIKEIEKDLKISYKTAVNNIKKNFDNIKGLLQDKYIIVSDYITMEELETY